MSREWNGCPHFRVILLVLLLFMCLDRSPLDEMSTRIDDLEKNIADLMTQAGVEEIEAAPEKAKEGPGS